MKSELAKVTRDGWPWPRPVPIMPPDARPKMPVTSCQEPPGDLVYCSLLNGCSHASTLEPTWLNMLAASIAPAAKVIRPMTIQLLRPVDVYSMATNMAKNMSEVPRSCCTMSTPIEAIHTTMIGPKSLMRGSCNPSTFLPPTAS